jgi:hypothetical protein
LEEPLKSLTKSYAFLAGLNLVRQDYLATLSELRSDGALTEPELDHLRREQAVEHRVRCAQEWKAISAQLKADQNAKT